MIEKNIPMTPIMIEKSIPMTPIMIEKNRKKIVLQNKLTMCELILFVFVVRHFPVS